MKLPCLKLSSNANYLSYYDYLSYWRCTKNTESFIFLQKSEKFPKALYYCRLCDYHCDRLSICIQHIEDTRHSRLAKMQVKRQARTIIKLG